MSEKPNVWELIENEQDQTLLLVIKGHLYIEYILNQILEKSLVDQKEKNIEQLGFYKKVNLLKTEGKISEKMKDFLISFNLMRNKYAHNLKFKPDYQEAFKLAKDAKTAGIYFKDERIFGVGHDSKDYYSISAIFSEVIINTFQGVIFKNSSIFPQDEVIKLMVNTTGTATIV